MTLERFLDRFDGPERSVVVVNRTDPDPVLNMLADTFGDDAVRVADGRVVGGDRRVTDGAGTTGAEQRGGLTARELATTGVVDGDDEVGPSLDADVLRRHEDIPFEGGDPSAIENLVLLMEGDEVVAGSTLGELGDAVLFVNSDLYITGSRSLSDVDLPPVISGLDDATFTLRGTPSRTGRSCSSSPSRGSSSAWRGPPVTAPSGRRSSGSRVSTTRPARGRCTSASPGPASTRISTASRTSSQRTSTR